MSPFLAPFALQYVCADCLTVACDANCESEGYGLFYGAYGPLSLRDCGGAEVSQALAAPGPAPAPAPAPLVRPPTPPPLPPAPPGAPSPPASTLLPAFSCAQQDAACAALGDLFAATNGAGWANATGWAQAAAGAGALPVPPTRVVVFASLARPRPHGARRCPSPTHPQAPPSTTAPSTPSPATRGARSCSCARPRRGPPAAAFALAGADAFALSHLHPLSAARCSPTT